MEQTEMIYQVDGDKMIIDWRKLYNSKVLTSTELEIFYRIVDKIEASQGKNVAYLR